MDDPIINQSNSAAFYGLADTPTKFTQSAASWNDLARIGTGSKVELKLMVFLITKQFDNAAGEDGCLDEVHNKGQ